MRVLINAGSRGSGGYLSHLKGILGCGCVPSGVKVFVFATDNLRHLLGSLDPAVEFVLQTEPWTGYKLFVSIGKCREYESAVNEIRPDIILETTGYLWGRFEIPSVVVIQNLLFFHWAEFRRYLGTSKMITMLLLRMKANASVLHSSGLVFLSPFSREVAVKSQPRLASKPSEVIPHGLTHGFLSYTEHCRTIDFSNGTIRIIYPSPIYPYKHQWHVVAGVALLRNRLNRDIRITLLGDSESQSLARLRKTIASYRAEQYVDVRAPVEQDQLPELYSQYDIFLFASSCESFGLTLLEAMAAGMPIACSGRSGLTALLGDGGEYFDPEDPQDISRALARIIASPKHSQTIAGRARERAEEYSWEQSASRLYAFLRKVTHLEGTADNA